MKCGEAAWLLTLDARADALLAQRAHELPPALGDVLNALDGLHVDRVADA
jgi:hypothetical protein